MDAYKFRPDIEVGGVSNRQRAEFAATAFRAYAGIVKNKGEDLATMLSDLLTDTLHLAGACGMDPAEILDNAHYMALAQFIEESEPDAHEGEGTPEPDLLYQPDMDGADIIT